MSWPLPDGSIDPITMWDIPWEPMSQSSYPRSFKNHIKSTSCRCTPQQKEIAHRLFHDPLVDPLSSGSKKSKIRRGLTRLRTMLPIHHTKPAAASSAGGLDNEEIPSAVMTSRSPKKPSEAIRITDLPQEILYHILQLVYKSEDKSRGLCHCSRPKTYYKTVRAVALEHRIVNTMTLRSVCSDFHTWALEDIFRSRNGEELEIDFSNFDNLKPRFKTLGAGVLERLKEDFPALSQSGVIIYLGSPGQISNMRSVLAALMVTKENPFSGISLWDLDYYYRDILIPGYARLVVQRISEIENISAMDWNAEAARALPSLRGLCEPYYAQDWQLFIKIVLELGHRPLSKLHLPIPSFLDLSSYKESSTLARLTQSCKKIVIREFWFFPERERNEIMKRLEVNEARSRLAQLYHMPQMNTILELYLRGIQNMMMIKGSAAGKWLEFSTSVEASEVLDATAVEVRHAGELVAYHMESEHVIWPNQISEDFNQFSQLFQCLKSVSVVGGQPGRHFYGDVKGLWLGNLLKALLPTAHTLETLVYRPAGFKEAGKYGYRGPYAVPLDDEHPCILIHQFQKLRKLDVELRLCLRFFEQDNVIDARSVPRLREWDLWMPCGQGKCFEHNIANMNIHIADQALAWQPDEMEKLGQSCQVWRNRHEEVANRPLTWSVTAHVRSWQMYRQDMRLDANLEEVINLC